MKAAHEQRTSYTKAVVKRKWSLLKKTTEGWEACLSMPFLSQVPSSVTAISFWPQWTAMLCFSCQERRHTLKSRTKINLSSIKMISSKEEAEKLISEIQQSNWTILFTLIWPLSLSSLLSPWASTFPSLFWPYCFPPNSPVSITWHFPPPLHGN